MTRSTMRRHALPLGLLVVLSLAMLYPMPMLAGTHIRDAGDPLEYAWVLGHSTQRLLNAPLSLFDGTIFYPFAKSLAYSDSTIASTLTVLPIVALTDNTLLATNLFTLLSFALAGIGTYLLAFSLTGNRTASLLGGVIFAFNPYRLEHLSQIPNIAIHWLPFVFLSLTQLLRGRSRWWAIAVFAFLSLQLLSSLYYAFVVSIALAVYLLGWVVFRPRRVLAVSLPLGVALVSAYALLVATSLPYFEVSRLYGMKRTLAEAEFYSARPADYLTPNAENRIWRRIGVLPQSPGGEHGLFPGAIATLLAGLGVLRGRPRTLVWAFLAVAASAFAITFGPSLHLTRAGDPIQLPFPLPFHLLYDLLPGFQSIRVPTRFAASVMLGVGVLAGFGWAWMAGRASRQPGRLVAVAGALVIALTAAEYVSVPISMLPIPVGGEVPQVYRWLDTQQPKGALVEVPIDWTSSQAIYGYYETYHGWQIVNGWRSFQPPTYEAITRVVQGFPSPESLDLLAGLRVQYAILHTDQLAPDDVASRHARLDRYRDRLSLAASFGADEVYRIEPLGSTPPARASVLAPCSVISGTTVEARLLIDRTDSPEIVAWPDAPARLGVDATWVSAEGRSETHSTFADINLPVNIGAIQLPVHLAAPAESGRYALTLSIRNTTGEALAKTQLREIEVIGGVSSPAVGLSGPPQLLGVSDLPLATTAGMGLPIRTTWRIRERGAPSSQVFVSLHDSTSRYWSIGTVSSAGGALQSDACNSDQVDGRLVRLHPRTPPGYYWADVELREPASERRHSFLDSVGHAVDKVTVGPIRVTTGQPISAEETRPQRMLRAAFGSEIELIGWSAPGGEFRPGSEYRLLTYWTTRAAAQRDYTFFTHLYDASGKLVAQSDGQPGDGIWPTSKWQVGDAIDHEIRLAIPKALPPGTYSLMIGVYDGSTGERLPIGRAIDAGDRRLKIGDVEIAP